MRYDDAMRTEDTRFISTFARLSFPATMMSTQAFGSLRSVWTLRTRPSICQAESSPGSSELGPG